MLAHVNKAAVKICTRFCVDMFSFIMGIYLKNPPASAGNESSVPGLGRSPGGGNGNPFQYSCLENSMDRGTWGATVYAVCRDMTEHAGTHNS